MVKKKKDVVDNQQSLLDKNKVEAVKIPKKRGRKPNCKQVSLPLTDEEVERLKKSEWGEILGKFCKGLVCIFVNF